MEGEEEGSGRRKREKELEGVCVCACVCVREREMRDLVKAFSFYPLPLPLTHPPSYLVTYSNVVENPNDPQNVVVWDIKTGKQKRTFIRSTEEWPMLKYVDNRIAYRPVRPVQLVVCSPLSVCLSVCLFVCPL